MTTDDLLQQKCEQARTALLGTPLIHFIGSLQRDTLVGLLSESDEREYFADLVLELRDTITQMPATYDQSKLGDDAVAHLHYFLGSADVWITERDRGEADAKAALNEPQHQAFGLTSLYGTPEDAERGYVSLPEILNCGFELDLNWRPKTLRRILRGGGGMHP